MNPPSQPDQEWRRQAMRVAAAVSAITSIGLVLVVIFSARAPAPKHDLPSPSPTATPAQIKSGKSE